MNVSVAEACQADLFTDESELRGKYGPATVRGVLRVRELYMRMLRTPSLTDAQAVKETVARHGVSRPVAYADLSVVKMLLPQLGAEAREFHRWRSKEMLLETYRIALAKMDVRTMERVAADYARTFRVSEDEHVTEVAAVLEVQPFVPTDDPAPLGIEAMPDRERRIRELLDELKGRDPDIVDVGYEDADVNEMAR